MNGAAEFQEQGFKVSRQPTPIAMGAVLWVGTIGMLICGVQPVVLGALVDENRLSSAGLGWATTAEFLTLGLGIAIAGAVLRPRRLRLLACIAVAITGLADLMMFNETGVAILINRAISGIGEALLVWITSCVIVRSAAPARWAGIFLTAQGISQLAFAALVPLTMMADRGANGGFLGLAFTAAAAIAAVPFLPDRLADLPASEHARLKVLTAPASIMVLLCFFLIAAFSIGLFAYLAPLSTQSGFTEVQLGFTVSVVLGFSILGSTAAAFLPNLPYYPILVVSVVVNALVLTVLYYLPSFPVFLIAGAVFGFFWLFFMPYQLPMAIEIDPSRQVAMVMGGAQLIGAAGGPFLCSMFVTDAEARGALIVVGTCFLFAFLIATLLHFRHRSAIQMVAVER